MRKRAIVLAGVLAAALIVPAVAEDQVAPPRLVVLVGKTTTHPASAKKRGATCSTPL